MSDALYDRQVVDYSLADYELKRRLQALMWLYQYGEYDSTSTYVAATQRRRPATNVSAVFTFQSQD